MGFSCYIILYNISHKYLYQKLNVVENIKYVSDFYLYNNKAIYNTSV